MCLYVYVYTFVISMPCIYLDSPFYRLHGHVLLDGGSVSELDHSLVNSNFSVRLVEVIELLRQVVNDWPDLTQTIVSC